MSLIEGGPFKCTIDGFTTTEVDDWNKHCSKKEGDSTHITEMGAAPCASCKEEVEFEGLPWVPFDEQGRKTVVILCEDCSSKARAATSTRKVTRKK